MVFRHWGTVGSRKNCCLIVCCGVCVNLPGFNKLSPPWSDCGDGADVEWVRLNGWSFLIPKRDKSSGVAVFPGTAGSFWGWFLEPQVMWRRGEVVRGSLV